MQLVPNSHGASLLEHNDCHSKEDGTFCSKGGTRPPVRKVARRAPSGFAAWWAPKPLNAKEWRRQGRAKRGLRVVS